MKKISFQKGFTLIELLVVVAIIGLISSVVLGSLNSARVKARDARRISDIKQIRNALELYYNNNNMYPSTLTQLSAASVIPRVPIDPKGNDGSACRAANSTSNGYCYAYYPGTAPTNYHLAAQLEIGLIYASRDSQFDSGGDSANYTNGFVGSADYIYDVKN